MAYYERHKQTDRQVGRRKASTAAGEVRNSRQASGQRQTQCAHGWKRRQSWVAVAESEKQTLEPPNSQRNFTWGGGSIDHQFRGLFTKICVSSCCKKRRAQQLTEAHSMHALFSVCSLKDDNVITSKPAWKPKHANSILESSEYFCQISSKLIHVISSYTVSKLGRFFETQCSKKSKLVLFEP